MPGCTQSRFGLTYAFKNTAEVHAKSLWGSQGRSKTPRKLEKTMHRWTQSHLGLSCAFKNTAQVHLKSLWAHTGSHFARKYGYILHGTLKNTCVFCYLGTWDHYFCVLVPMISCVGLCFAQLCIYSAWGPQNTLVF